MAAVAGLGGLVEDVADFGGVGGVADSALAIEDAHLGDAGLFGDGLNGVVKSLAIVVQHVVRGAASDHVADPFGAGQGGGFEVLAMQSDIEVSENCEDDEHDGEQGTDQLRADAVSQALGSASAANWVSLRHCVTPVRRAWIRFQLGSECVLSRERGPPGKSAGTSPPIRRGRSRPR